MKGVAGLTLGLGRAPGAPAELFGTRSRNVCRLWRMWPVHLDLNRSKGSCDVTFRCQSMKLNIWLSTELMFPVKVIDLLCSPLGRGVASFHLCSRALWRPGSSLLLLSAAVTLRAVSRDLERCPVSEETESATQPCSASTVVPPEVVVSWT